MANSDNKGNKETENNPFSKSQFEKKPASTGGSFDKTDNGNSSNPFSKKFDPKSSPLSKDQEKKPASSFGSKPSETGAGVPKSTSSFGSKPIESKYPANEPKKTTSYGSTQQKSSDSFTTDKKATKPDDKSAKVPPVKDSKIDDINQKNGSINKILLAAVIFLLICLGALGWLYIENKTQKEEVQSDNVRLEKEADILKTDLSNLKTEFNTLTTDNEDLNGKIQEQQAKIDEYIAEIEKNKGDKKLLRRYRREASSLRKIMQGYVVTIDSLNTANKALTDTLNQAKQEIGVIREDLSNISNENSDLKQKVARGSILQTTAMITGAIRVRSSGKQSETKRASQANTIKACFDIEQNNVADSGQKEVFLRVIKPDGSVLVKSGGEPNEMIAEGSTVQYTMKRDISYQNQKMNVCFYYDLDGMKIPEGKYQTEIYCENSRIGKGYFELK